MYLYVCPVIDYCIFILEIESPILEQKTASLSQYRGVKCKRQICMQVVVQVYNIKESDWGGPLLCYRKSSTRVLVLLFIAERCQSSLLEMQLPPI